MKSEELFKLRKEQLTKFQSITKLRNNVNKLIPSPSKIPLVAGYLDFNEKNWEVLYLTSKETSDEITLINFLEGLNRIEKMIKENPTFNEVKDLKGTLLFQGVNNLNDENWDTEIITIGFQKNCSPYYLNIYWSGDNFYRAESKKELSLIEKIMDTHIGPNKLGG